ncbi:tripartite motif-containing protein 16-like, partial [Clarias magur]
SLQFHCVSSRHGDSPSTTVNQHLSFDGVRKSLSDLEEELIKIPQHAVAAQMIFSSEPQSREDFLHYFCDLTLDPNTVNYNLILSEENRAVTCSKKDQPYSDHPQRFDYCNQ